MKVHSKNIQSTKTVELSNDFIMHIIGELNEVKFGSNLSNLRLQPISMSSAWQWQWRPAWNRCDSEWISWWTAGRNSSMAKMSQRSRQTPNQLPLATMSRRKSTQTASNGASRSTETRRNSCRSSASEHKCVMYIWGLS